MDDRRLRDGRPPRQRVASGALALVVAALTVTPTPTATVTPPAINVMAYGAKCDGTTDDTAAVRAALDAVPSTGGAVYVPPGIGCIIDGTIGAARIKSRTMLFGEPDRSVLKLKNASWTAGVLFLRNIDATNGNGDITIQGLVLDGNDRGNNDRSGTSAALLRLQRCTDCQVIGVTIRDTKYAGIDVIGGAGIMVRDSTFERISQIQNSGDAVQANGVRGITIENCTVTNADEGFFCQYGTAIDESSRDCVIRNNRIENLPAGAACTASGAPYACCSGWRTASDRLCTTTPGENTGCLCEAGTSTGSSIECQNTEGCRITGNTIARASQITVKSDDLAGETGEAATRDVVVAQNTLVDLADNPGTGVHADGAIIVGAEDLSLSRFAILGNTVRNSQDAGIRLYSETATLRKGKVRLNAIDQPCTAQTPCGGIFLDAMTASAVIDQVTVSRNTVVGTDGDTVALRLGRHASGTISNLRLWANDLRYAGGASTSAGTISYASKTAPPQRFRPGTRRDGN